MGSPANPTVDKFGRPVAKVDYSPAERANKVSFALTNIPPQGALYVGPTDVLGLFITNSVANTTLNVQWRFLHPDGSITYSLNQIIPPADRVERFTPLALTEGWLLGLIVNNNFGLLPRGACFVEVVFKSGSTPAAAIAQTLISDYVSSTMAPTWPSGTIRQSTEGPGNIRTILGAVPAAGAEIVETVPVGARWRFIAFGYSLTTAVAAANRESTLVVDDGVNSALAVPSGFTQIASLAHIYNFAPGVTRYEGAQALRTVAPFGSPILLAGGRLRTLTTNIQGADQYTAPTYLVEEWLEH